MSEVFQNFGYINCLVNGYLRENYIKLIPNDIIERILDFYDYHLNVIIFNNKYKNISNNIYGFTRIYTAQNGLFFKTLYDTLYTYDNNYGLILLGSNELDNILNKNNNKNTKILKAKNINNEFIIISNGGVGARSVRLFTKNKELFSVINGESYQPLFLKQFKDILIQIENGIGHTLYLTLNGALYGDGWNAHGQLSFPHNKYYSITRIKYKRNISQIASNFRSSIFVDFNDNIITFGSNEFGELGIGNHSRKRMNKIWRCNNNNNYRIKILNGGLYHNGFITMNGKLYMFGNNMHGQCGINNIHKSIVNKPKYVCISNNKRIKDIKCGGHHSIILTYKNEYYSFGFNDKNQCLLNIKKNSIHKPTKISIKYIQKKTKSNKKIIDIFPADLDTYILQKY